MKNSTRASLEEKIVLLEKRIRELEAEQKENRQLTDYLCEEVQGMERKYRRSVKRELGYREMLYVFNPEQAPHLLQDYVSRSGLQVTYASPFNTRSN